MELVTFLIDFILHVDKYLETFVQSYGMWVYALLFVIVFVETGVVVMPFLPGDSLLFIVGALCGAGFMSFPLACAVLIAAAILGDQSNYLIGRFFGPKVFRTRIRSNIALAEAPSSGTDIFRYSPKSMGAQDYLELCVEIDKKYADS